MATAWGATLCGAKPVFVDCYSQSYNIDPNKVQKAISKKTIDIVAVHLYGQRTNMAGLKLIAKEHKIQIKNRTCDPVFNDNIF